MAPSVSAAEAGLALATTAAIAFSLHSSSEGWRLDVGCLAGLALLVCAVEAALGSRLKGLYSSREAEAPGLALGTLLVPWVLASASGLHVRQGLAAGFLAFGMRAALAASALTVVLLVMQLPAGELLRVGNKKETPTLAPDDDDSPFDPSSSKPPELSPPLYTWPEFCVTQAAAPVALAVVTAAAIAGMLHSGSLGEGLSVLAVAALGCCLFQAAMQGLPHSFTLGEGVVAAQALCLLAAYVARCAVATWQAPPPAGSQYDVDVLVASLLLGSVVAGGAAIALLQGGAAPSTPVASPRPGRPGPLPVRGAPPGGEREAGGWGRRAAAAAVLGAAGVLAVKPAVWVLRYAFATWPRAGVLAYWAALLAGALPAMAWLAASQRLSNIIVRKGYHLLAVALFTPPLLAEPALLGISLAVAFAALVALEVARLSGLPGIGPRLHAFMTSFTDGRDSGLLLVTHFTLLLGMAVPVWLSNALHPASRWVSEGDEPPERLWPAALAGLTILGLGDAAASVAGRAFGRLPICAGSRKTVEGAAACAGATLLAWLALAAGGGGGAVALPPWGLLAAATAASSLLEAVTAQLDNVFVPLHYFALLSLL